MSETQTVTQSVNNPTLHITLPKLKSVWYLPKPKDSIFSKIKTNEYPTLSLMYGFIQKQMGLKLRKHMASIYADEQTLYKNYLKLYDSDENCIKTGYSLPLHGWGRIAADRSLSLSLFRRRSRHTFANKEYMDFDMVSAQPKMFYEKAKLDGISVDGLEEYCADPKAVRRQIVEHYKLEDKHDEDGSLTTAMEQAKELVFRMAFGGGIAKWKQEFVSGRVSDLPLIKKMETTLKNIRKKIVKENPHIRADLDEFGNDHYQSKTEDEKERTVMALYAQTLERLVQEHAIAHLVRTYDVPLCDIVPSQDGFMPLKNWILQKNINITSLFSEIKKTVKHTFGMEIDWAMKSFDEVLEVPHSDIVPLNITEDDLILGETHIAKLLVPCLKNKLIYQTSTEKWYFTDSRNVWVKSKKPDEYLISTTIQYYIKELQDEVWKELGREKNAEKKEELKKKKKRLDTWFRTVGQSAFQTQVTKFLRTKLQDEFFYNKLNKMKGKIVFYNGIFDLKLGVFRDGIRKDDFVSFTLARHYTPNYNKEKMAFLRGVYKKITNNNDIHLEYVLGILGYSFTGDASLEKSIYYMKDGTEGGKGDNGKTLLFETINYVFAEYMYMIDPSFLEENNKVLHKQIPVLEGKRCVYADEGTKNKLNNKLLKKVGDGDRLNTDVLYGNSQMFDIDYKLFVCSNFPPNLNSAEEGAVYNRYKQAEFCSKFVRDGSLLEDDPKNLLFIADTKLKETLKNEYQDEIMALIIEYAMKYYAKGIPVVPKEFEEATKKTEMDNNEFGSWFYENYEKFEGNRLSIYEIQSNAAQKFATRKEVIKQLGIIKIKWSKDLKNYGVDQCSDVKSKAFGTYKDEDGKDITIVGGIHDHRKRIKPSEEQ